LDQETFLFVVPSTYSQVYESELHSNGVDVVIYANHLLRASFPAMKKVSLSILKNSRAAEAESEMLGINEILDLIPNTRN
jgi:phosphoenolpyruvate phosphomutase